MVGNCRNTEGIGEHKEHRLNHKIQIKRVTTNKLTNLKLKINGITLEHLMKKP